MASPVFPGSAQEAGANLHNNATYLGQVAALGGRAALTIPDQLHHGFASFLHGLISGQAGLPAAPAAATKAPAAKAPATAAARTPAKPAAAAAAAVDPLGALGNLSFRQLLTLSQASENLQPKGSTKAQSTPDAAGAALASIYQQQFKSSIDAAGKDPAKQQAAIDAFEKKMKPLALKGNTADEYLYGDQ